MKSKHPCCLNIQTTSVAEPELKPFILVGQSRMPEPLFRRRIRQRKVLFFFLRINSEQFIKKNGIRLGRPFCLEPEPNQFDWSRSRTSGAGAARKSGGSRQPCHHPHTVTLKTLARSLVKREEERPCSTSLLMAMASSRFWHFTTYTIGANVSLCRMEDTISD